MRNRKQTNFNSYNYNVMDSSKAFFYVMLINISAPIVFLMFTKIIKILVPALYKSPHFLTYMSLVCIPLLFIIFIAIYHKSNKINISTSLHLHEKISIVKVLIILVMLAVTIVCFFPLVNMLYSALERIGLPNAGGINYPIDTWWRLLLVIAPVCILPAIAEEILFRGMMLKGLESRVKPWLAIVISSLAFFIMHGSIQQTFYQIILGIVLGLIGYYAGNIIYPMLFHFLNNLSVVIMSYFNIGGFLNGFSFSVGGWFGAIGLSILGAGALFGLIFLLKKLKKPTKQAFEMQGNNIIIEEPIEKQNFKQLLTKLSTDEKFYFYSAWFLAIIIWLFNSL